MASGYPPQQITTLEDHRCYHFFVHKSQNSQVSTMDAVWLWPSRSLETYRRATAGRILYFQPNSMHGTSPPVLSIGKVYAPSTRECQPQDSSSVKGGIFSSSLVFTTRAEWKIRKAEIQTAGAWCISKYGPDGSRQQVFVVSPMLSLVLLAFCEVDH